MRTRRHAHRCPPPAAAARCSWSWSPSPRRVRARPAWAVPRGRGVVGRARGHGAARTRRTSPGAERSPRCATCPTPRSPVCSCAAARGWRPTCAHGTADPSIPSSATSAAGDRAPAAHRCWRGSPCSCCSSSAAARSSPTACHSSASSSASSPAHACMFGDYLSGWSGHGLGSSARGPHRDRHHGAGQRRHVLPHGPAPHRCRARAARGRLPGRMAAGDHLPDGSRPCRGARRLRRRAAAVAAARPLVVGARWSATRWRPGWCTCCVASPVWTPGSWTATTEAVRAVSTPQDACGSSPNSCSSPPSAFAFAPVVRGACSSASASCSRSATLVVRRLDGAPPAVMAGGSIAALARWRCVVNLPWASTFTGSDGWTAIVGVPPPRRRGRRHRHAGPLRGRRAAFGASPLCCSCRSFAAPLVARSWRFVWAIRAAALGHRVRRRCRSSTIVRRCRSGCPSPA